MLVTQRRAACGSQTEPKGKARLYSRYLCDFTRYTVESSGKHQRISPLDEGSSVRITVTVRNTTAMFIGLRRLPYVNRLPVTPHNGYVPCGEGLYIAYSTDSGFVPSPTTLPYTKLSLFDLAEQLPQYVENSNMSKGGYWVFVISAVCSYPHACANPHHRILAYSGHGLQFSSLVATTMMPRLDSYRSTISKICSEPVLDQVPCISSACVRYVEIGVLQGKSKVILQSLYKRTIRRLRFGIFATLSLLELPLA